MVLWRGKTSTRLLSEDVSFRGLFLRTDDAPSLRQLVRLEIAIPDGPTIAAHAMAVWVVTADHAAGRVPGAGLQFYGLGAESRAAWERFVGGLRQEAARSEAAALAPPDEAIRRRHRRIAASFQVRPRNLDDLLELVTRDISAGGMFLETTRSVPPGTIIEVDIVHPVSRETFDLLCVVRRQATADRPPPGIGVEFVEFDDARRQAFGEFVYSGMAAYEELEIIREGDAKLA